jgi:hypothetical protein
VTWNTLHLKDANGPALDAFLASVSEGLHEAPNGELTAVEASICTFERKFGFQSDDLRGKIHRGEVDDSDAVEAWVRLIRVRNALRDLSLNR